MPALHSPVAIAPRQGASRSAVGARRAERCDTLIAAALLVLLVAGWMLNFFSFNQLTLGLGSYFVHAPSRQA